MWPFPFGKKHNTEKSKESRKVEDLRKELKTKELRIFYSSKHAEEIMGPIHWTMKDKCIVCGRRPNVAAVNRIANKNVGFPLCKEHRDEYPYIAIE